MSEPSTSEPRARAPLHARDVQTAVLEQLLGDVDELVERIERVAPELHAAAERLEEATRASQVAFEAGSAAAKTSVGEWIAQRTNEVTARALQEHLNVIDAAVAASVGRATLSLSQTPPKQVPTKRVDRLWLGVVLGASTCTALSGVAVAVFWR